MLLRCRRKSVYCSASTTRRRRLLVFSTGKATVLEWRTVVTIGLHLKLIWRHQRAERACRGNVSDTVSRSFSFRAVARIVPAVTLVAYLIDFYKGFNERGGTALPSSGNGSPCLPVVVK